MVNGRLRRGIFSELAKSMGFQASIIARHWHRMERSLSTLLNIHPVEEHTGIIQDSHHILFVVNHSRRGKGKFKESRAALKRRIRRIPLKFRRTRRLLASQLNKPLTTVQWLVRERPVAGAKKYNSTILKVHSSTLKPSLTNANKLHRLLYCMSQVKAGSTLIHLRSPVFEDQMDRVHVDEKWFWLCKDGEKYILVDGERPPKRYVRHKSHIEKVMFLCAQARPRWDPHTQLMWDGKLGIWPVGDYSLAIRSSVNRPAGATVWNNESMDRERYIAMMVQDLFPAIMSKWPRGEWADPNFKIKIQQDNAPAHPTPDDENLVGAIEDLEEMGIITPGKISFCNQPPNSPDLNILDLGLFNAMQAAYWNHSPKNSIDIIKMVEKTYKDYPTNKINRVFVTLQTIFDTIIKEQGDNQFKIPHLGKDKLEKEGRLPLVVKLSQAALDTMVEFGEMSMGIQA
jgi:hypothetical protein